jgi:drug/metabolite transporter (DMT)-like permease
MPSRRWDPGTTHFYTGLVGLLVTTAALPAAWQPLPWGTWLALVLMGILGTLGHFLLIVAYRRASVAVLTPFLYLQIAFATLGGWLVFAHVPDEWALLGIGLVAVSGVAGTWITAREVLCRRRLEGPESTIPAILGADAK